MRAMGHTIRQRVCSTERGPKDEAKRQVSLRRLVRPLTTALSGVFRTRGLRAAMGPNDKSDLVIKGGEVLNPSQKLRAKRDVGVRFGLVEAVDTDIPAARANRVLNAEGKLVTPGLIDLHAHVFPYGSPIGIPADELVPFQGTTTVVSAGDAGANNVSAIRRQILAQTSTRLYEFVTIAKLGLGSLPVA